MSATDQTARAERILLVEDDEFSSQLVEMYLRKIGFSAVTVAKDGREALETARNEPFDLMVLDLNLPRLNGAEVLRRLKKNDVLDHMAVLVISSLTNIEDTAQCMEFGADDFLPKPFNSGLLQQRALSILERRRLLRLEAASLLQDEQRRAGEIALRQSIAEQVAQGGNTLFLPGAASSGAVVDRWNIPGGQALLAVEMQSTGAGALTGVEALRLHLRDHLRSPTHLEPALREMHARLAGSALGPALLCLAILEEQTPMLRQVCFGAAPAILLSETLPTPRPQGTPLGTGEWRGLPGPVMTDLTHPGSAILMATSALAEATGAWGLRLPVGPVGTGPLATLTRTLADRKWSRDLALLITDLPPRG